MNNTTSDIFSMALALPSKDRAALARELIQSLDEEPPDADWETAWVEELDRRIANIEAGNVQTRDWRVVIASIDKKLQERAR